MKMQTQFKYQPKKKVETNVATTSNNNGCQDNERQNVQTEKGKGKMQSPKKAWHV